MTAIKHALLAFATLVTLSSTLAVHAEESSAFVERNHSFNAHAFRE
ncbi:MULTISPECIES: hypothetical protein [unclassified Pseudomonas]|nr:MULTISPECIES: hypothetical protein [unclassified Pseudomonas]